MLLKSLPILSHHFHETQVTFLHVSDAEKVQVPFSFFMFCSNDPPLCCNVPNDVCHIFFNNTKDLKFYKGYFLSPSPVTMPNLTRFFDYYPEETSNILETCHLLTSINFALKMYYSSFLFWTWISLLLTVCEIPFQ